jgi:hypothetical protein
VSPLGAAAPTPRHIDACAQAEHECDRDHLGAQEHVCAKAREHTHGDERRHEHDDPARDPAALAAQERIDQPPFRARANAVPLAPPCQGDRRAAPET